MDEKRSVASMVFSTSINTFFQKRLIVRAQGRAERWDARQLSHLILVPILSATPVYEASSLGLRNIITI